MNYEDYALKTLDSLGIHSLFKGSEYILCCIGYLHSLDKYIAPDVDMHYDHVANQYVLTPMSIENSIRNVIRRIWTTKENPTLMLEIFGDYNFAKRPCNMEFIMMLYSYVRLHLEDSDRLRKLDKIWTDSINVYKESNL